MITKFFGFNNSDDKWITKDDSSLSKFIYLKNN
jgi:hypothetical protein